MAKTMNTCPICNGPLAPTDAACPACGFKILGSTQRFQPIGIDDDAAVQTPASTPIPLVVDRSATLRIIRGPQTETVFSLGSDPLSIGRSPQCDIFLNDMTVSREHAAINPTSKGYIIHDLDSYNGIWINNENVSEAMLKNEDIVQIGAFLLLFTSEDK